MSIRYTADPKWIKLKFPGNCANCKSRLKVGANAYYCPRTREYFGKNCCTTAEDKVQEFETQENDNARVKNQSEVNVTTGDIFYHSEVNMDYHQVLLNGSLIGLLYRTRGEQLWSLDMESDLEITLLNQLSELALCGIWTTIDEAKESITEHAQRKT